MKLYFRLPLLILTLFFSAKTQAQHIRIGFPPGTMTVGEALESISAQSGYRLSYSSRSLDAGREIRFTEAEMTIEEALADILAGTGLRYSVQGRYILIQKDERNGSPAPVRTPYLPDSRNGETYVRTPLDTHNNVNRRRQIVPPVIVVADTTTVVEDDIRSGNTDTYTSYVLPLTAYMGNRQPRYMIKTNLLHGLAALSPNIGVEFGLGRRTSLEMHGGINAWRLESREGDNKKLAHILVRPEVRWWTCERMNGHFFGVHAAFAHYNIGSHTIPMLFKKQYRYEGIALGGGLTYGYHLPLNMRWGVEFNIGAGAMWLKYDRFDCEGCQRSARKMTKTYFGPTRAGITLVFNIK